MNQDIRITPETVAEHGLSEDEYRRLVQAMGREPNITELGIFSVLWSEHCSYKSSKIYLKKLPTTGPYVIQGPGENAGIIDIGNGLALAFKVESHNHPSFIEPFQGAATGVGGILRDVFTMGARPIASLNSLRFGSPDHPKTPYLLKGVVNGIAFYGNCFGCPTVGGEVSFDECYNGNILVNAFNIGIVEKDKIFRGRAAGVGNPVFYVGSKTGRDGIHGATMASDVFGKGNEERRPTVQVGDPFTEKRLLEACLEAFATGAIVGIQDMGAAGLTSSSSEMAARAGTGIEIDLDKVPRREEGLTPYELMLSESQERMLMVVEKGREGEIVDVFNKWDLDVVQIGRVTEGEKLHVYHEGKIAADIPIPALVGNAPVYERPKGRPAYQDEINRPRDIIEPRDYNEVFKKLIGSPNLASKEWVYRQYDHMVGVDTVVTPGSDAAVLRIKGTSKGVALSMDCNSRLCYIDPYWGAALAVAECARNLVASGAVPMGVSDCLNFGNPERPEIMWQFEQAVMGLGDACREFATPVVSGNVSFYNESSGISIYPTPTVTMVGLMDDVRLHTTQYFKDEGDTIILLGENTPELGGSEYLKQIHGLVLGPVPTLSFDRERALHRACLAGVRREVIKSAHDISDGGLAVALAECTVSFPRKRESKILDSCFRRNDKGDENTALFGAVVKLEDAIRPDALLFGEAPSRIIISVKPEDVDLMLTIAKQEGVPARVIGKVGGKTLVINDWICVDLEEVDGLWRKGLTRLLTRTPSPFKGRVRVGSTN